METTIVYWVYIEIMEKRMETTIVYWVYIGIMEKRMETTIVYWGYIGRMEKKMETTIVYWVYIGIMEKRGNLRSQGVVKALRSEGRALEVLLGWRKAPQKFLWRDPIRFHFCLACAANFFYCHGPPWSVAVVSSLILCSDFLPQRSHQVTCRCVRSCVIMGKSKKVLV